MDTSQIEELIQSNFQVYKGLSLLVSLVLIAGFQMLFPNRLALRKMFRNWKINFPLALINVILLSLLCGACVSTWAVMVRERQVGFFEIAGFPYWLETILTVLLLDFVAWIWHLANHRWPLLWRFHAVHHSDAIFETSTAFRFHPGELLISLGIRLLVVLMTGLPLLGLILFEVIYGAFNLFVHSDIRLPVGVEKGVRTVLVTPSLHRLHHSVLRQEHDRNYGTIFSFWDRLARTLSPADANSPIEVGLRKTNLLRLNLKGLLKLPFGN